MKKLIVFLALLTTTTVLFSQTGFFKGVDNDLFKGGRGLNSVWLFRPVVELTAMQFTIQNPIQVESLSSLGTGISYQHFVPTSPTDPTPYNNFGVNGLVLFTQDPLGVAPAKLAFAVTANVWQYLNVGAGYSLAVKKFFILTGITYNFN